MASNQYDYAIICCARWETAYIGEWIRYHDHLGFSKIYLYCNDDDPAELRAEVARTKVSHADLVTFVHFPGQGQQAAMYLHALGQARQEANWITFLDVDEFMVLPRHRTIGSFIASWNGSVDSVVFNWLCFGNSGFVSRPPGSVLTQYTRREEWLHINTKHISRVELLGAEQMATAENSRHGGRAHHPFWHGLYNSAWDGSRRVTVLGDDIMPLLADYPVRWRAYLDDPARAEQIRNTGVINHYMMKSVEDFRLRAARGLGGEFINQAVWQNQFENGNYQGILDSLSRVEDTRMRRYALAHLTDNERQPLPDATTIPFPSPSEQPLPPLRRIVVRHRLWTAELVLGSNRRLRHDAHGSLGWFHELPEGLRVAWDKYPAESFIRRGTHFESVPEA